MIQEDFCSYEVAKLLKEKGFPQEYDIYHSMVYNEEDYEDEYEVQRMVLETRLVKAGTLSSYPIGVPEPKCYCPTLQMAIKWLREEHDIFIQISAILQDQPFGLHYSPSIQDYHAYARHDNFSEYITYEEAVEVVLKYCLENLI